MKKLSGKTAVITGGNSGIGLATARLFREQGARVAITGRDKATLDKTREQLGGDTLVIQSDAGKLSDIYLLSDAVKREFGQVDILFANAAIAQPAPFEMVTETQFDETTAVNFKGVFFTIQKFLPLMSPKASVVITTSVSNQVGATNFSVYAACKAALHSLTQTLALELIGRGIRVNAISPGPINTPGFGRWGVPQEVVDAARADLTQRSPIKRFGEPEEIAKAALFLASDDSSLLVGTEIVADGGISLLF